MKRLAAKIVSTAAGVAIIAIAIWAIAETPAHGSWTGIAAPLALTVVAILALLGGVVASIAVTVAVWKIIAP